MRAVEARQLPEDALLVRGLETAFLGYADGHEGTVSIYDRQLALAALSGQVDADLASYARGYGNGQLAIFEPGRPAWLRDPEVGIAGAFLGMVRRGESLAPVYDQIAAIEGLTAQFKAAAAPDEDEAEIEMDALEWFSYNTLQASAYLGDAGALFLTRGCVECFNDFAECSCDEFDQAAA